MKGFLDQILKAATLVITFFGVILLPQQVYGATSSMILSIVTSILILLVFAFALIRYYYPGSGHWKAGYSRYPTEAIITRRNVHIGIAPGFTATIKKCVDLIFMGPPNETDLIDFIDSLPNENISERHYSSTDSEVSDIRQKSPNNLVVYWRPKSAIEPLQLYTHCSTHVSPSRYGPDAFYNSTYFDRSVGVSNWEIDTPKPIGEAMAFVLPIYQSQVTLPRLYRHWRSGRNRGCEQPTIVSDNKVVWTVRNPLKGRVYVLFAIYKGETERFIADSKAMMWRNSILQSAKKITGWGRRDRLALSSG